ncbi:MAG: hypothetical protein IIY87_04520 [Bacteroidales bacterium]|nr:hypothetical protein [Bacteroidales bacterium]
MKKIKFLALALVATLAFSMTSCDKDKDYDYKSVTLKDGDIVEFKDFGVDDTAAYKLHFRFGIKEGNIYVEGMGERPLFAGAPGTMADLMTEGAIMDYGKVSGMTKIETIPDNASFVNGTDLVKSLLAEKKHGYVIKVWGDGHINESYPEAHERFENMHDPNPAYVRVWIQKIDDADYIVRYEYPFVPKAE